jgi:hypothetical protein
MKPQAQIKQTPKLYKRRPLFAGDDYIHQLHLIFNLCGTPHEEDFGFVSNHHAAAYIKSLPTKQKYDFYTFFNTKEMNTATIPIGSPIQKSAILPSDSAISLDGIDLLERMLTINPRKRIKVSDALNHPYFSKIHSQYPPLEGGDDDFEESDAPLSSDSSSSHGHPMASNKPNIHEFNWTNHRPQLGDELDPTTRQLSQPMTFPPTTTPAPGPTSVDILKSAPPNIHRTEHTSIIDGLTSLRRGSNDSHANSNLSNNSSNPSNEAMRNHPSESLTLSSHTTNASSSTTGGVATTFSPATINATQRRLKKYILPDSILREYNSVEEVKEEFVKLIQTFRPWIWYNYPYLHPLYDPYVKHKLHHLRISSSLGQLPKFLTVQSYYLWEKQQISAGFLPPLKIGAVSNDNPKQPPGSQSTGGSSKKSSL